MPVKHSTLPSLRQQDIARFHSKVRQASPDSCWEWAAARFKSGYGQFFVGGLSVPASRIAYLIHYGNDPGELFVLHSCDNPPCCNPCHLSLGTNDQNMAEKIERSRQSKGQKHVDAMSPTRARGERVNTAKLSAEQVKEIRKRRQNGESLKDLSDAFGVTKTLVSMIALGKVWKHV